MVRLLFACCAVLLAYTITACAHKPANNVQEHDVNNIIGYAEIDSGGVIVLYLHGRDENGVIGRGIITYNPDDLYYEDIIRHVGDIEPGDKKPVKAWPKTNDSQ